MVQVYMHDYGMIGKYAIINTDDEAIAIEFKSIPEIVDKLNKIYQEYKNYKAPTLEEFYVAHPEAKKMEAQEDQG